ncbi:MAG TPA: zinc metallopeptidase [Firmicutes bacterium]|nr:zinc metallopeptidase [Bacillota bacterium]
MLYYGDSGLILVFLALILAFYAQSKVSTTFRKYAGYLAARGMTGAQVAADLLYRVGLGDVRIEMTDRELGDHYDPRERVLRLSPSVYNSRSVAALGVAAHEVGHAIQHDTGYFPLALRNNILPIAQFGSQLAWPLFLLGLFFGIGGLMDIGIVLFFAAVMFQIVTLPVEYNASARAIELLEGEGYLGPQEIGPAREVLSAAALTYLAATAMAVAQLARLLILRSRRD